MTADPRPVCDWLMDRALLATPVDILLEGCADRLVEIGIPLLRGHISATTLHPEFAAVGFTWRRGRGLEARDRYEHDTDQRPIWQQSPLQPLVRGETGFIRHRLDDTTDVATYPVLGEFREMGGTDYMAQGSLFGFGGGAPSQVKAGMPAKAGMLASWVTDRPGGFTEADIAALKQVQPAFGLAVRTALDVEIAQTVMATYLGPDAGARVLDGEIRRGHVQVIDSAILFADLRGFTALSDTVDRAALVPMLNAYLAALADPVDANGGQVLKFLGDGLLATFALGEDGPAPACAQALAAAAQAFEANASLNAQRSADGQPVMTLGIALHLGDVLYGNVGSTRRLDFTVIGPAVNAASRMEALCGALDCPLLISGAFVEGAGAAAEFRSVGRHRLRGIGQPQELFTVDAAIAGRVVESMRY